VKVAQNYYYPGWWEGCGQGHNMINMGKWNELPKAYKAAIEVASGDAWAWVVGKYDYVNPQGLKKLIAQGAKLHAFPQPVLEACYKAAQDLYAEISKENPMFKKLYDSMLAFRGDSTAWNQVAELGFDSFMMRMRTRT
jgi:TRAP-type mannitol/chloroaromatic compound transport system substrate-binding protein